MAPSCPHCEQSYSSSNPPKRLINCSHSLCLQCLASQILCPIDHKRIERRRYTLEAFQTNAQIMALLDSKDQKEQEDYSSDHSDTPDTPALREKNSNISTTSSPEKCQKQQKAVQKQEELQFEQCLLHNKRADLICLEDKCLICANCGLFGEHKNHNMLPYDKFALDFGMLTEQCVRINETIKQKQSKISPKMMEARIQAELKLKQEKQQAKISQFTTSIIESARNLEKDLLGQLEQTIVDKKKQLLSLSNSAQLNKQIDEFNKNMNVLNNGLNCVFSIQNIEGYISYLDESHPKSNIMAMGQEIISKLEQEHQQFINRTKQFVRSFSFEFSPSVEESLRQLVRFDIKERKKKYSQNKEEILICEPEQMSEVKGISPIGPVKSSDESTSSKFLIFADPQQIVLPSPHKPQKEGRTSLALNKISLISRKDIRGDSICSKDYSKGKNMNSSNLSQKQMLSFLNTTQTISKKKKLDLPGKYSKIYDELLKDQLDFLDLGGAFLGQQTILKISQAIPSRTRLKAVKMMNNKLGDQVFPILVERCRNIGSLNLSYNNFTEKVLEYLQDKCEQLGYLENITLSNNKIVLRHVKERLETLKRRGLKVSL